MKNTKKKNGMSILATLSLSAMLAACGGGGGGGSSSSSTSAPASAPATSAPLATSATNPFPGGSGQSAMFAAVNAYRSQLGVGVLADDPVLDTSATAHAQYLEVNIANGKLTSFSHNEISTYTDYYADTPLARAEKAGAPATESVGEVISASPQTDPANAANDCVTGLLDTVYHLVGMTDHEQTMGIGLTPNTGSVSSMCVLDFGYPLGVGQQMAPTAVVHVPLTNETGVRSFMMAEAPNPTPDFSLPGRPIMVRVRADQPGDVLTVSSFTLIPANGSPVTARIFIPAGAQAGSTNAAVVDSNNLLPPGVVFLIPQQQLALNTVYTASFSGARDGASINTSWSFTTGAQ